MDEVSQRLAEKLRRSEQMNNNIGDVQIENKLKLEEYLKIKRNENAFVNA
jgi:hypothetical protein